MSILRFGRTITPDDKCAVCNSTERLVIDHDHSCCPGKTNTCGQCVRGVLCTHCNLALGHMKDNVEMVERLVDYLKNSV